MMENKYKNYVDYVSDALVVAVVFSKVLVVVVVELVLVLLLPMPWRYNVEISKIK